MASISSRTLRPQEARGWPTDQRYSKLNERRLPSKRFVALGLLFAIGLAVRVALVPYLGTHDMKVYAEWGRHTNKDGLTSAYIGIYFPLAYQLFAGEVTLASWLGVSTFAVMKAVNLFFDLGTFFMLVWFLRAHRLDGRYAFYYWLHPYFLAIFWLGYVDSFLSFFAMLSLLLLGCADGVGGALVAGLPLAAVAVYKPQALALLLVTGLLVVALFAVARHVTRPMVRLLAFLSSTALAFLGYSLYFKANGFAFTYLGEHSLDSLKRYSPGLTANMLNVWTPVADHYVRSRHPLYTVTGPGIYHGIGSVLVAAGFVVGAWFVAAKGQHLKLDWQVLSVMTLGALLLPFLGTRAHENHLFLGLTFAIIALAAAPSWPFAAALNVVLAVQFVNLVARYGFGANHLTRWSFVHAIVRHYGVSAQVAAAWVMIVSFPLVVFFVGRALVSARAGSSAV